MKEKKMRNEEEGEASAEHQTHWPVSKCLQTYIVEKGAHTYDDCKHDESNRKELEQFYLYIIFGSAYISL